MADGKIREQRVVLKDGIVMLFGKGFQSPDLVGHTGEVVDVLSYKEGESEVTVKAGGKVVKLSLIQDLAAEKIVTGEPAQKVICVVDLDADDDLQADAFEIYSLSKDHGWLLVMRVKANECDFDPESGFYHRLFKVVKSGQSSHVKFSQKANPEE